MPSVIATLQALLGELRSTIAEQRAMVVRLEERVRDLETRVGHHSGNSSGPPSSGLPGTPKRPQSLPSVAWDAVADPVTSPTSGPWRHPDGSKW